MYNKVLRLMPPPPDYVNYDEPQFRIEDYYLEITIFIMFVTFIMVLKIIDSNGRRYNN